jgi:predicted RecB family nuclease
MGYINKTVFINYIDCPTLGWMTKRRLIPRQKGLNDELLMLEGRNIHKLSWKLFPQARKAQKSEIITSEQHTGQLIEEGCETILEASFTADGFSVRTDILQKNDSGKWHLFEVKSGSKYKVKYAEDMAFSAMVLAKCGIDVESSVLMHLSNAYRLGMDDRMLFNSLDCTEKVALKTQEYLAVSQKAFDDIESDKMPEPYLKRNCKNCPAFDNCAGKGVKNHIFDLPRLSGTAIEELISMGIDTIEKVPEDFELTQHQRVVKNCVINNTVYISADLKTELDNIKYPVFYLDFESVTTIMPLYRAIAPHTQLLTQFSVDKSEKAPEVCEHFEYIADHTKDCRRERAEKLVECLGKEGSIITYSNSEKIAIGKLSGMFPDLCEDLKNIAERIVDLEAIVRKNYYDIRFRGRSSIKKVLPVMIPEMNYEGLVIGEGGDAAAAFAFMAMGLYGEEEILETKKNLLKYCAQDTFAMVKIHKFLIDAVNGR